MLVYGWRIRAFLIPINWTLTLLISIISRSLKLCCISTSNIIRCISTHMLSISTIILMHMLPTMIPCIDLWLIVPKLIISSCNLQITKPFRQLTDLILRLFNMFLQLFQLPLNIILHILLPRLNTEQSIECSHVRDLWVVLIDGLTQVFKFLIEKLVRLDHSLA